MPTVYYYYYRRSDIGNFQGVSLSCAHLVLGEPGPDLHGGRSGSDSMLELLDCGVDARMRPKAGEG